MNIIIAGAGKVGKVLARQLASEGHALTVIDQNSHTLETLVVRYDAIGVQGNCASRPFWIRPKWKTQICSLPLPMPTR